MNDWPPFSFIDEVDLPQGISADATDALNERLGGVLRLVPGPWKKHLQDLEEGRLDALFDLTPNKAREEIYGFTNPYLTIPHVIVAKKDGPYFASEVDLNGKTLALERGFGSVKRFRENWPQVKVVEYDDTSAALDAVARGEADAYAGNRAVAAYIMEREVIVNLKMHGRLDIKGSVLAIGTRKDWPLLTGVLQKALDDISREERRAIVRKWVSTPEDDKETAAIDLTAEEKAWLDAHKKIRVMVGTWPPFHYVEDGEPKGLAIDYVTTVLDRLGLKYELKPILRTEALAGISNLEKIDLLPTIARNPEREKLVKFTNDYLRFPSVIFGQKDADFAGSLKDFYGRTVAVEKNFIAHKRLERDHPQIKLLIAKTSRDAVEAVSLGKADAYVGNLASGSYLIEKFGFANVKVAAPSGYPDNIQAMGVRKDWPELAGMIDKVLASMSEEDHNRLRNKALGVRFEFGVDTVFITKVALLIGGVVGAIFVVFIAWNRGLGKEIAERKRAEGELAEKEAQLRNALESMSGGLMMVDKDLIVRVINDKIVKWYDISEDVAKPGVPLRELIRIRAERGDYGPGDCEKLVVQRLQDYAQRTIMRSEDRMQDGRIIEMIRAPTDDGGVVIACSDITERKHAEVELHENLEELEKFNRLAVGRELRMIDLKQEINGLLQEYGKEPAYEIVE